MGNYHGAEIPQDNSGLFFPPKPHVSADCGCDRCYEWQQNSRYRHGAIPKPETAIPGATVSEHPPQIEN